MRYMEYKSTGTGWVNLIPVSWESEKIASLFSQRKTKVSDKDYPALSVAKIGIVPQLETAVKTDAGDNRKLVCTGDFVINSRSDRKGSCGVAEQDGSVSLINIVLTPRQKLNSSYVHYLLRSQPFSEEYYRYGRGIVADLWTTRYSEMKNIILPVPPREEQDQIVLYLDWKISIMNRLIAGKKSNISKLQEFEQSMIYDIITGNNNNLSEKKDSGINWAKIIPANWAVLLLSQVADEQCIKNTGMAENNLLSLSYGQIVEKDINTTDGLLPLSFESYQIVYPGNIVLRLTDLQNDHRSLRTGLATEKGIITSAYTTLRIKNKVTPKFLHLQLHASDLCKVFYGMGGGVRQSIGYQDIRRMAVFVPSIEEQERIVALIEGQRDKISPCINAIKGEIRLLEEMKIKLISEVVAGKIDVRGIEVPDFEMVEETDTDESIDEDEFTNEAKEQEGAND